MQNQTSDPSQIHLAMEIFSAWRISRHIFTLQIGLAPSPPSDGLVATLRISKHPVMPRPVRSTLGFETNNPERAFSFVSQHVFDCVVGPSVLGALDHFDLPNFFHSSHLHTALSEKSPCLDLVQYCLLTLFLCSCACLKRFQRHPLQILMLAFLIIPFVAGGCFLPCSRQNLNTSSSQICTSQICRQQTFLAPGHAVSPFSRIKFSPARCVDAIATQLLHQPTGYPSPVLSESPLQ